MNVNELVSKKSYGPRKLPKAGTQPARLLFIADLGVQERTPYQGKARPPARQLWWCYELVNDKFEYKDEIVPFRLSPAQLNVSMDPKSQMFKLINAHDPGGDLNGDLEKFLNLPCLVTVVHAKVGENTYANFAGVMQAPEGFPVAELHDSPQLFSFDKPTPEAFQALPNYIREKITSAENYKGSKVEAMVGTLVQNTTTDPTKPAVTTTDTAAPY